MTASAHFLHINRCIISKNNRQVCKKKPLNCIYYVYIVLSLINLKSLTDEYKQYFSVLTKTLDNKQLLLSVIVILFLDIITLEKINQRLPCVCSLTKSLNVYWMMYSCNVKFHKGQP